MKLCIIVPMYNEEGIVRESVGTILAYTKELSLTSTLVIVNDASKDKTPQILNDLLKLHQSSRFQVLHHTNNQGYGAALKTGVDYAMRSRYDYVLFMDSDLTNHPKYLASFVKKIEEGFDYIKATRYASGGGVVGVPWRSRLISFFGNLIAKKIYNLPLTDITNGFRAARVSLLRNIRLEQNNFSIILEELNQVKKLTKNFCEVPYTLTVRTTGKSRFSYTPRTCLLYLKMALKSRNLPSLIKN